VADEVHRAVRAACLWLPETEEHMSHGSPNFRVRGKSFASYVVNHHGDGRVALWLSAAPGLQEAQVAADPARYFVPPYLGVRGWLGVHLDKGLSWQRIAALARDAYANVAPAALVRNLGPPPAIATPRALSASERDPLQSVRGRALLRTLRKICLRYPECREALQFGSPVWQAGRRTFASARHAEGRLIACFWVGVDQQELLIADPRYRIPAYLGSGGWIALDVTQGCDEAEIASLALQSYRHFALKRMLVAMTRA
jgi:hypothetical protein